MAITQIIGRSGQGKTLFQTKLILEEVQSSPRPILSNLPMDFGFWRFWIFSFIPVPEAVYRILGRYWFTFGYARYFDSDVSIFVYKQIEVCYDYAVMVQWANALDQLEYEKNVRALIQERLSGWYDKSDGSVFHDFAALAKYPTDREVLSNGFVWALDELASYFSAREFRNTPPQFLQLLTQHRKMRIDLIGTTQRYTSVDSWFRELAHNVFLVRKSAWIPRLHKVFAVEFDEVSGTESDREVYRRFIGRKKLYSVYDTDTLIVGRQKISLIQSFDKGAIDSKRGEIKEWLDSLPPLLETLPEPTCTT